MSRTPWGLIILLGSLTALAPVGIDMYLPSLPAIAADMKAAEGQVQNTVSAFLAGMAIGQFFYGPASDRFGRRAPILFGIALFSLASVGCALATTPGELLVGRFLQALGGCAGPVIARAVVRDRFSNTDTARVLSLMMMIMGIAPVTAPLAGGLLLSIGGWQINFWAMSLLGAAIGLAVLLMLRESRTAETAALARVENPFRAYLSLLRDRRVMGYVLAGGLHGAMLFTYISSSPGLIIGTYGFAPAHYGMVFATNGAAVLSAGQINRILLRRRTPDQVLIIGMGISSAGALGLVAAAFSGFGGPWTVLPMLFVIVGCFGLLGGNTMAGALNADPLRAGSISALAGGASFALGAMAAWITAAFHDGTARPMATMILLVVTASMIALFALALSRKPA